MALNTEIDLERKQPLQGKDGWRLQFTVDTYRAIIEDLKAATGVTSIITSGGIDGGGTGNVPVFLSNTGAVPGSYTTADITVDEKGRITAVSSGSGGAGSAGTANEHQVTDNAGGFVTSIMQETGGVINVGGVTDANIIFGINSSTKGVMLPRMVSPSTTLAAAPPSTIVHDNSIDATVYKHAVNGFIPVGRYALNGTTINGGSAPAVNQIFTSAQIDGRLSYAPLAWTYSGGYSSIYPLKYTGTGGGNYANERVNLGTGTYRFGEIRQKIAYMYNTLSGEQAIRMIAVGGYTSTLHPCGTSAGTDYGGTAIGTNESAFAKFVDEGSGGMVSRGLVVNDTYAVGSTAIAQMGMEETAILQLDSTTRGFLPPRMTTVQMNAIATPATGLMIYDITTNQWMGYNGTSWVIIG